MLAQERAHLARPDDVDVLAASVRAAQAREQPAHVPRDRPRGERVEKVVVGPVVPEPEDEVRRLLAVREEAADVDALVHAERAYLAGAERVQTALRGAREVLVEVVQELARAPRPVLRLGLPVVPGDLIGIWVRRCLQRLGDDAVEQPPARREDRLVGRLMDERVPEANGRAAWQGDDQAGVRQRLDGIDQLPLPDAGDGAPERELDVLTDDGRGAQAVGDVLRQALDARGEHG